MYESKMSTSKWVFKSFAVAATFFVALVVTDVLLNRQSAPDVLHRRVAAFGHLFIQTLETPDLHNETPDVDYASAPTKRSTDMVFRVRGLRQPEFESASDVRVSDLYPVIGVSVGNEYRAYLLGAMDSPESHVINDLIENIPVTVTYCDRTDCVRLFTKSNQSDSLDVSIYGFIDGQMAIEVDGQTFTQGSPDVPLEDLTFTRTTWGEWKLDHPETNVYIGDVPQTLPTYPAD